jgi:hypothetical protein
MGKGVMRPAAALMMMALFFLFSFFDTNLTTTNFEALS